MQKLCKQVVNMKKSKKNNGRNDLAHLIPLGIELVSHTDSRIPILVGVYSDTKRFFQVHTILTFVVSEIIVPHAMGYIHFLNSSTIMSFNIYIPY